MTEEKFSVTDAKLFSQEELWFDRELTPRERDLLGKYLNDKYSLTFEHFTWRMRLSKWIKRLFGREK